jgi:hypothetical protein
VKEGFFSLTKTCRGFEYIHALSLLNFPFLTENSKQKWLEKARFGNCVAGYIHYPEKKA